MNLIQAIKTPSWAVGLKPVTSKCRTCQRTMTLRQFSTNKAGIRMHDQWYCSSPCFTAAVERELSELLPPWQECADRVVRMPLGLVCVSRGLLTHAQLKQATDEQKRSGGEIGDLLVQTGAVSEKDVTAVRAAQWGCPVFSMPRQFVPTAIRIPSALIRLYSTAPLHYVTATNTLLVGFIHRIEYGLLYVIEQVTGCKTQPCFVTPSDFEIHLQRIERAPEKNGDRIAKQIEFEDFQSPVEMAKILCTYGVDLEAEQATIKRYKDYIWARLKCGHTDADLVFRAG
jgi:hypothetical protein